MSRGKKNIILLIGILLILVSIILVIALFGKEKEKKIIVGMVLTGGIDESGWNGHHYRGLKAACDELNATLLVKQNVSENSGECEASVLELIDKGAELIILGSYNYSEEISELINKNPNVSFYCCTSKESNNNSTGYSVRLYQARYLAGIVAGLTTKNDKIGYVAAMSNSEVNRGINAFTLGAQSVNSNVQVHVVWTGEWSNEKLEKTAVSKLVDEVGVDLVTYHQNQDYVIAKAEELGIYSIGYHEYYSGYSEKYLTAATESWDSVYREIIKEYMQGNGNTGKLIWIGIEKNAVGLAPFTSCVNEATRSAVEDAAKRMQNGWEVFSGQIISNDGTVKCQDGEAISDDILFGSMDWLVKGVTCYED